MSTALSELAERQELIRRPDGSWLLRGDPPDAQMLARKPTAAELRGQDVLRPSRRFARDDDDVQPDQLIAAMDRLREALDPGELKELLERRRGATRDSCRARARTVVEPPNRKEPLTHAWNPNRHHRHPLRRPHRPA